MRARLRKIRGPVPCHLSANMNIGTTIATALVTILTVGAANGQQPADSHVKQAAFSRPASTGARQQVTFARQATHVGDEIEQNVGLQLRMTTTMRQVNEMVGKS